MADAPQSQALLDALRGSPADVDLRARAARALDREGKPAEAARLLVEGLRNLTAHAPPPLPCLCKRCLDPARAEAEVGGERFVRDFAVAEGRVLFYWVPPALRKRVKGLPRSVEAALAGKLKKQKRRR